MFGQNAFIAQGQDSSTSSGGLCNLLTRECGVLVVVRSVENSAGCAEALGAELKDGIFGLIESTALTEFCAVVRMNRLCKGGRRGCGQ